MGGHLCTWELVDDNDQYKKEDDAVADEGCNDDSYLAKVDILTHPDGEDLLYSGPCQAEPALPGQLHGDAVVHAQDSWLRAAASPPGAPGVPPGNTVKLQPPPPWQCQLEDVTPYTRTSDKDQLLNISNYPGLIVSFFLLILDL